jgi:hypothetical protein
MSQQPVFALLGKREVPTDAVEQYCRCRGAVLQSHDFQLEIRRVPSVVHDGAMPSTPCASRRRPGAGDGSSSNTLPSPDPRTVSLTNSPAS